MPALFSFRDATCYRDWDALPLAVRELCRLFPSLWAKAAERWLEKEPLDAHRDIISSLRAKCLHEVSRFVRRELG
jgi:hypothetical protein